MNRRHHIILMVLASIVITAAVVGAGVYVVFEKPQKGIYSGPGVPMVHSYKVSVGSNDSYCAIPIFVNYSGHYYINETLISTSNSGSSEGILIMLMNQTDYSNLRSNKSLNYVGSINSLDDITYYGGGVQTYYLVLLNELSESISLTGVVQVKLIE